MFLMNTFFDGAFLTFGFDVIAFAERDQEERIDPMIYIFPRMTKCTFNKFGTSGEVEKHDALCILPLNVVNEKIYIFLWFWFLILGFLTALVLLYRLIIILSPRMRAYLLYIRFRLINREVINTIVRKSKMGDWFLFYMLGQNVDSIIFKEHRAASGDNQRSSDINSRHILFDSWSNAPSTSAAAAAASLSTSASSAGAGATAEVRLLYDTEIRDLEAAGMSDHSAGIMGFRTPNGIIIRHHLGAVSAGSFRRPKAPTRRDSYDETAAGSVHMQTHRQHGHSASSGQPKFREHGRAKFAPSSSSHGYRH
ncbi:putative Innexin shaking-B [Daphnia magna]|uniref:Innexin n=1 Tax=Daphnia magna TaxID=35525 RepID=A0A162CLR2_9CRUS|nr:putative Innexin shaking-B [Daphnia magna]